MSFLSSTYVFFLLAAAACYWMLPRRNARNAFLLAASYGFYAYAQAWYPLLLLVSTAGAYASAIAVTKNPARKSAIVWANVGLNIGALCFLKYASTLAEPTSALLHVFGLQVSPATFAIALPLGASFFTLQSLSYVIDVANGKCAPRKNIVDVALLMALFPKLVSGPLERGEHLLPQLETYGTFKPAFAWEGTYLLARGFLKKMVVAENIKPYVNQIYDQEHPLIFLFVVATVMFSVQIVADFSGYTDMARGSAKLFGIDLFENFKSPYRAVSPSDFWRRWHITLSAWFRDYVYIPLGGSRTGSRLSFLWILLVTMVLSGAWHGAAAIFLVWGAYHGLLLFGYNMLGFTGNWQPKTKVGTAFAVGTMYAWTLFGWMLFRSTDIAWLSTTLLHPATKLAYEQMATCALLLTITAMYSAPWIAVSWIERGKRPWAAPLAFWLMVICIGMLGSNGSTDFIYFRF